MAEFGHPATDVRNAVRGPLFLSVSGLISARSEDAA